ncbi:hypothetical protein AVEN_167161-1 [Araneus ventricosus]|uniref:Uncharacterized protein n=1 Tax=Araneus ventricosus TaxID=182803 RepID=A0A4Y2G2W6_ARAVE|nr:hypothetical protein AVEN_167161-1 [Araneus ventricosus]
MSFMKLVSNEDGYDLMSVAGSSLRRYLFLIYAADSEEDVEKDEQNEEEPEPNNQKLEDVPEKDEKEEKEADDSERAPSEKQDEDEKKEKEKEAEEKKEPMRWTRPKRPTSIMKTKLLVNDVVKFIEEMKQKITQEDMDLRVIPSPSACRFELPIDMTTLEGLNPLQYISKHCRPAETRRKIYATRYEEYREEKNVSTVFVSEIRVIYERLFHEAVLIDEMLHLRRLLDLDLNQELDVELFVAVSCLMERIILKNKGSRSSQEMKRNVFEVADFCSLNGKLHGIDISPKLRSLLEFIRIM